MSSLKESPPSVADSSPPLTGLRPLQYDPLPTPTSVRLLEILPIAGPDIHCTLVTVDLNDDPAFDALSYTWGNPVTIHEEPRTFDLNAALQNYLDTKTTRNAIQVDYDEWQFRTQHPFVPFEKVAWDAERRCPVICNGQVVLVTENLVQALHQLRRAKHFHPDRDEMFELMMGSLIGRPLWIDMICINQADIQERNTQIRIMGRIFESAGTVFGWLGPEANLSRRAGAAIEHIMNKLLTMNDIKDFDKVLPPNLKALFVLEGVLEADVYAIFALFQRLWFRRAWVIQEVVLAKKLVVMCGGISMQWGGIELFVSVISSRNLYSSLSNFGIGIMSGGPTFKDGRQDAKAGFRSLLSLLGDTSHDRWKGELSVDPLDARDFILGVGRLRTVFERQLLFYQPSEQEGSEISHPAEKDSDSASEEPVILAKDFTRTGKGTTECGRSQTEGQTRLEVPLGWHEMLIDVCRSCAASDPRDKIFSLFGILEKTGSQLSGISWDYLTPVQDLYKAVVLDIIRTTRRLDILAQVQDPSRTKLQDLPSWIPDFSVSLGAALLDNPLKPKFRAGGAEPLGTPPPRGPLSQLSVEGFFVDNVIDVAATKGCYFVRTAKIVSRLPPRYHPKGRPSNESPTRSCAYWRTLVGNGMRNDSDTRAVLQMGFGFSQWITEELVRAYRQQRKYALTRNALSADSADISLPDTPKIRAHLKNQEEKMRLWLTLARGEPEYIDFDLTSEAEVYVSAGTQLRFLPDEKVLSTIIAGETIPWALTPCYELPESPWKAGFMARMAEMKRGHRMFRTPNNYLGMGPVSTQVGDEVWVLKGARTPFILRRKSSKQYELIGEAYVHGIMDGEAATGDFRPTSLELV